MNRAQRRHPKLLEWHLTTWKMNGKGGWLEQPIILVEGQVPFFADHPQSYIDKLEEMSKDPTLIKGAFHTMAGQLKDALEQYWSKKHEKSSSKK
jgi:hypothetical protein